MKQDKEFTDLVTGFRNPLNAYAIKLTRDPEEAGDLTQDTMLRALLNADKFQSGTNIKAWLYTIMRNIFINKYRRAMKSGIFNDPTDDQYFINSSSIINRNEGEANLIMKDVEQAMSGLNDKLKTPFLMSFNGYKYEEIATKLQVPLGTVKVRIHNARKELMRKLKSYNPGQ